MGKSRASFFNLFTKENQNEQKYLKIYYSSRALIKECFFILHWNFVLIFAVLCGSKIAKDIAYEKMKMLALN